MTSLLGSRPRNYNVLPDSTQESHDGVPLPEIDGDEHKPWFRRRIAQTLFVIGVILVIAGVIVAIAVPRMLAHTTFFLFLFFFFYFFYFRQIYGFLRLKKSGNKGQPNFLFFF